MVSASLNKTFRSFLKGVGDIKFLGPLVRFFKGVGDIKFLGPLVRFLKGLVI